MTVETPIILTLGKYQGKSLDEVLKIDPGYLKFIYHNSGYGRTVKDWLRENMTEIERLTNK